MKSLFKFYQLDHISRAPSVTKLPKAKWWWCFHTTTLKCFHLLNCKFLRSLVFYCSWEHWFESVLVFQFNLKIVPTILIWSQPCETLYFSACVCGTSKAWEGPIWVEGVSSTQMYLLPLVSCVLCACVLWSCVLCPVFCVLVFCVCGTSKAGEGSIFPGVENVSDNWETCRQHWTLNNPLHKSHIRHFCD